MSWYRNNPLFAFAIGACVLIGLGELWWIHDRWSATRATAAQVVEKQAQLEAMREVTPPPTRETAAAIEADLERAQRALAAMQEELKGRAADRWLAAKVPAARTDAYFDLATFVERMRELARRNDVDVRPEAARFGFAAHTHEGPDADRIEPVFRQRQVAQYLLEALLESRPRALLAVKREVPVTQAERAERLAALRVAVEGEPPLEPEAPPEVPEDSDFFTIDPRMTAREPGYVDTLAFRVVFTGETAALRDFLNRLATFELPVIVRQVEVEPATLEETTATTPAEETAAASDDPALSAPSVVLSLEPASEREAGVPAGKASGAASSAGARRATVRTVMPIVTRPWSRFTVTVEHIDLLPPAAAADDTPPAEAAASDY